MQLFGIFYFCVVSIVVGSLWGSCESLSNRCRIVVGRCASAVVGGGQSVGCRWPSVVVGYSCLSVVGSRRLSATVVRQLSVVVGCRWLSAVGGQWLSAVVGGR